MASDHQHPLRMPVSAAEAGAVHFNNGRPVILNLGIADADVTAASHAPGSANSAPASPTPVTATIPSVRSLLMSCEGSLPFVLIILAKLLYDHRLGTHPPHLEIFYVINRDTPITSIGRFADNRYRPISTFVSSDCRLHSCKEQVFIFITKSKQT